MFPVRSSGCVSGGSSLVQLRGKGGGACLVVKEASANNGIICLLVPRDFIGALKKHFRTL